MPTINPNNMMGSIWVEMIASMVYSLLSVGIVSSTAIVTYESEILAPRLVVIALGNGFAYASAVYLTTRVTKDAVGYLNPAITSALMISNYATKRYTWGSSKWPGLFRGIFLLLAQLLGLLAGALIIVLVVPKAGTNSASIGTPDFSYGADAFTATGIEAVGSFFLTFIVLAHECRAPVTARSTSAPIAVGLAMTTLTLFAYPFTGSAFNPFKSLWLFVIALKFSWTMLPFIFGPFIGSLLAVMVYMVGFTNSAVLTSSKDI